jgi:hypothetical protein
VRDIAQRAILPKISNAGWKGSLLQRGLFRRPRKFGAGHDGIQLLREWQRSCWRWDWLLV